MMDIYELIEQVCAAAAVVGLRRNWGHDETLAKERLAKDKAELIKAIDALQARIDELEGTVKVSDERLRLAGLRAGLANWGCETPDMMADIILTMQARIDELQFKLDSLCTCIVNPQDERYQVLDPYCPIHGKESE